MQLSDLLPAVGELIPYDYETIRTPEYETLLAGLLAGAVSQTAPHFVQIGGIPGAGKTTFCKNSHWDERLFISFDKIMESLPAYRQDIYRLGAVRAFNRWEMPARIIGYEALRRRYLAPLSLSRFRMALLPRQQRNGKGGERKRPAAAVYSSALKVRTAIISFACSRSRMSWSTPK